MNLKVTNLLQNTTIFRLFYSGNQFIQKSTKMYNRNQHLWYWFLILWAIYLRIWRIFFRVIFYSQRVYILVDLFHCLRLFSNFINNISVKVSKNNIFLWILFMEKIFINWMIKDMFWRNKILCVLTFYRVKSCVSLIYRVK